MSAELSAIIKKLYDNINSSYLREHEQDYVETIYKKVIYSNRAADPAEIKTIKKIYQMYLVRSGN